MQNALDKANEMRGRAEGEAEKCRRDMLVAVARLEAGLSTGIATNRQATEELYAEMKKLEKVVGGIGR